MFGLGYLLKKVAAVKDSFAEWLFSRKRPITETIPEEPEEKKNGEASPTEPSAKRARLDIAERVENVDAATAEVDDQFRSTVSSASSDALERNDTVLDDVIRGSSIAPSLATRSPTPTEQTGTDSTSSALRGGPPSERLRPSSIDSLNEEDLSTGHNALSDAHPPSFRPSSNDSLNEDIDEDSNGSSANDHGDNIEPSPSSALSDARPPSERLRLSSIDSLNEDTDEESDGSDGNDANDDGDNMEVTSQNDDEVGGEEDTEDALDVRPRDFTAVEETDESHSDSTSADADSTASNGEMEAGFANHLLSLATGQDSLEEDVNMSDVSLHRRHQRSSANDESNRRRPTVQTLASKRTRRHAIDVNNENEPPIDTTELRRKAVVQKKVIVQGDWRNKPETFNSNYMKNRLYKRLVDKVKAKTAAVDCHNSSVQSQIKYTIGARRREIGANIEQEQFVMLENGQTRWMKVDRTDEEWRKFDLRMALTDLIELRLVATLGVEELQKNYGRRYLDDAKEEAYQTRLRAIEEKWSTGMPEGVSLILEDWTGQHTGADDIEHFKFARELILSEGVQKKINGAEPFNKHCLRCNNCTETVKTIPKDAFCCQVGEKIGGTTYNFMCDEGCVKHGDPDNVGYPLNAVKKPLICVFRDATAGWCVRVLSRVEQHGYITQAIGRVNLEKSTGGEESWDFPMATVNPDEEGLVIAMFREGNEARFLNNSCNPNIGAFTYIKERYGYFFNRVLFLAKRVILEGEEISFNYFLGYSIEDALASALMKDSCECGTRKCHWKQKYSPKELKKIIE